MSLGCTVYGLLTCLCTAFDSEPWRKGLLPLADVWPPEGLAAPAGSCGRWRPGGSQLNKATGKTEKEHMSTSSVKIACL